MEVTNNTALTTFLRETADSIERGDLKANELRSAGEFYMKQRFIREVNADDDGYSKPIGESGEFDMQELVKFLSLGWYIYCVLLKDAKKDE